VEGDGKTHNLIKQVLLKVTALHMNAFMRDRGEKVIIAAFLGEANRQKQYRVSKRDRYRSRNLS
jgi:hypothetical protein